MATKAETTEAGPGKKSRLNTAVPGVGMLRTYKPAWLRFDLVAGIVLAAILVPQGMAYAELAGLPPVTGLYTTIACLVGYALLGPSRVLVLGPDSSVSPLIFAAIVPLLVDRRPGHGHRARRDARAHGRPHRDRPRPRQARVRRRPALQGGPGRLHERAGHHHHRRPAAQALRLLDRRRHLRRRGQGVLRRTSTRPTRRRCWSASARSRCCSGCRGSRRRSRPCSSRSSAPRSSRPCSTWPRDGVKTVGTLPQGCPRPSFPWTSASDLGRCWPRPRSASCWSR